MQQKKLIDAELYGKVKRVDMIQALINSCRANLNKTEEEMISDFQLMKLIKGMEYNNLLFIIGESERSKIFLDPSPNTILDISELNLAGLSNE